jgi:hypothetical protein
MEINQDFMVTPGNFKLSKYSNGNKSIAIRPDITELEQVIIHCTASGTPPWEDPKTCIKYDLGPNHISRSGLATATYHFYINQKGESFQLVSMQIKTSHCAGQNSDSVAICINHDGFNKAEITPELYKALVDTICYVFDKCDWGYDEYGVRDRLHFHRDYSPKKCPGELDKEQLIMDVVDRLKSWGDNE